MNAVNNAGRRGRGGRRHAGSLGEIESEDVFVIADEPNNQVVVKAPLKLQPQIKRMIDKLDLRRPQVYIEATIVAISDSKNFRLAVEAQQIIGQFAFATNFGLGAYETAGDFLSRRLPVTNLQGITAAPSARRMCRSS